MDVPEDYFPERVAATYDVGPDVNGPGAADATADVLAELASRTRETATLSVPGEHEATTLDFVQSPLSVRSVAEVGRTSAAHATAVGKVFLAHGGTPAPDCP